MNDEEYFAKKMQEEMVERGRLNDQIRAIIKARGKYKMEGQPVPPALVQQYAAVVQKLKSITHGSEFTDEDIAAIERT